MLFLYDARYLFNRRFVVDALQSTGLKRRRFRKRRNAYREKEEMKNRKYVSQKKKTETV